MSNYIIIIYFYSSEEANANISQITAINKRPNNRQSKTNK